MLSGCILVLSGLFRFWFLQLEKEKRGIQTAVIPRFETVFVVFH